MDQLIKAIPEQIGDEAFNGVDYDGICWWEEILLAFKVGNGSSWYEQINKRQCVYESVSSIWSMILPCFWSFCYSSSVACNNGLCVWLCQRTSVQKKKKDNYLLCACWFNWVIWSIVKFSFQSFLAPSSSSTLNFEASYSCDLQWLCESWMQTNHVAAPPACMRTVCN